MEKGKKQLNNFVKSDIMCKCNKGLKRNLKKFFFFLPVMSAYDGQMFTLK